jgi:hypothetical protein
MDRVSILLGEAVVIHGLRRSYESFRGVGQASLAIPPFDGPYKPNQALEHAPPRASAPDADNLIQVSDTVHFSSGADRMSIGADGAVSHICGYGGEITAMASTASGMVAVAARGRGIALEGGRLDGQRIVVPGGADVTALTFEGDKALVFAIGSTTRTTDDWTLDLLEKGRTGQVIRHDFDSKSSATLATGLPYPWGIAVEPDGALLVSGCWSNQIMRIAHNGRVTVAARNLPGYPARIVSARSGGYWLSLAAPRNQLLEFVLREDEYCRRMVAEIRPRNWIAPAYAPSDDFLQPMQQGSQRMLGILKPWAPSLSYGLVVLLDPSCKPLGSYHSRADGTRHGITSILDLGRELFFTSRGAGVVASLPIRE